METVYIIVINFNKLVFDSFMVDQYVNIIDFLSRTINTTFSLSCPDVPEEDIYVTNVNLRLSMFRPILYEEIVALSKFFEKMQWTVKIKDQESNVETILHEYKTLPSTCSNCHQSYKTGSGYGNFCTFECRLDASSRTWKKKYPVVLTESSTPLISIKTV
jgi:hypothetical protein